MSDTPPSVNPYPWATDANYSSGPKAGLPTKVAPSLAYAQQGLVPDSPLHGGVVNEMLNVNAYEWIQWLRRYAGGGWYGDGSDGDLTTAGGGVGDFTLIKNSNYDTLVVSSGDTLTAGRYVLRARTSITIQTGALIEADGNAGANGAAGVGGSGGADLDGTTTYLKGGGGGGGGGNGVQGGGNGVDRSNSYGKDGGAGGNTSANNGGLKGDAVEPIAREGDIRTLPAFATGALTRGANTPIAVGGGAGGGGGGSNDAVNGGGGGGGQGGNLLICLTPELIIEGTGKLAARGGDGGDGTGAESGGGGGGGGGAILLLYRFSNDTVVAMTADGRIDVSKGAGGAPTGIGTAGADGVDGQIIAMRH